MAFGAANWVLGKVVSKLSDDFLEAWAASKNLGTNYKTIKTALSRAHGVLNYATEDTLSSNGGLHGLLLQLTEVAEEAGDVVDEIDYFRIKDALDGTKNAAQEITGAIQGTIFHATHAAHEVRQKWFSCLSCCQNPQGPGMAANSMARPPPKSKRLRFNRGEISDRMKSLAERLPPLCGDVTELLKLDLLRSLKPSPQALASATGIPTPTTPLSTEKELYGRGKMLKETVDAITVGNYHDCPLAVLPILGVGGIGKTAFAQHLYNNPQVESHYKLRAWVCVSQDFDVLSITREIYKSIRPKQENHHPHDLQALHGFTSKIQEIVKTGRFLLVLDNVWNVNANQWNTLLAPFSVQDAKGGVVLVTTRFRVIEPLVQNNRAYSQTLELKGIKSTEFERLFFRCAFGDSTTEGHGTLVAIGKEIAGKLKGSPLAAKTVGRLLMKNLTREHWAAVLGSKEWARKKDGDDIIPVLKLTYDHLPFHLQQCFLYCALFPHSYLYSRLELVTLWISTGLLDPRGGSKNVETEGEKYLEELVENGVFEKNSQQNQNTYTIQNLFNELAQQLSRDKFLCIEYPTRRPADIQQSVRHLSIIIPQKKRYSSCPNHHLLPVLHECLDEDDGALNEEFDIDTFKQEMHKLKKELDIKKLHTLMLFGEYDEDVAETLQDTFKELESIRFLRLVKSSIKYLPPNFPKFLHLRGLSIKGISDHQNDLPDHLLNTISEFYHLKVLDLGSWPGELRKGLGFSRLVKLCHLIASYSVHSSIAEVGKMKFLQNLVAFHVKKELSGGFELEELGSLEDLAGTLCIDHLENARTRDEASKAKLVLKWNLACLKLSWDKKRPNIKQAEENEVLEGLKPNSYLSALHIENHGGTTCPSWLGSKISFKNLNLLCLNGVSWNTNFPDFSKMIHLEKLELRDIDESCSLEDTVFGYMENRSFQNLNLLCFFPSLEELRIEGCPKLTYLPFSQSQQCDGWSRIRNSQCFPKLLRLYISSCPLLSLPMPCTPTLQCVEFDSSFGSDDCLEYSDNQLRLAGKKKKLEYCNLEKLQKLTLVDSSHVSSKDLKMLTSLQTLIFHRCSNVFLDEEDDSAFHLPAVRVLILNQCGVTGEELARLLRCFPALSYMQLKDCGGTGADCGNLLFISSSATKSLDGAYLSNLWALASLQIPECTNIRSEPSDPQLYSGNSEMQDSYNPNDILSYAQDDDIKYFLSFPQRIFVDSVSGVLIPRICNRFSASVRRMGFCFDNQVQRFTDEQNHQLRRMTYLVALELRDCKSLQSLPEGLQHKIFLKLIYIKNCPGIKSISADSLPKSLERIGLDNCSMELVEQCRKLKGDKLDVRIFT